jgi:hypothetical protein
LNLKDFTKKPYSRSFSAWFVANPSHNFEMWRMPL